MENPKSLYQKLSDNGLYTKTYEDFVGQYGNPTGQKELYNKLSSNGLYTKSEQDFVGQYWAPEKKNSMASVGQQKAPTIPSVSPKTSSVTPSVSPASTEDKVRTSNLGITGVDWSNDDKEEISVSDDLWNTIKGAGVKAFSTLASLPNKAQEAALNMFVSATGMSSDFNKLPSADKKQIKNSLSSILRGGQQAGGTALAGQGRAVELSDKATQFLNKKSEDIYQKTRQDDVDVIDELDKFRQNPNAESIEKILYQGLKTTVESIPNMAIGAVSLPLLGVASAAGKMEEDIKETGGNMGIGYLLNAGVSGTAEAIFEGATNKILKKAAKAAFGNQAASKAVAEGFVKSVLKDMGEEGLSEGATTLVQDLSDKITKGEPVEFYKVAKNVANSAILGAMSGGGISGAGKGIGGARRYLASKIMPKDQAEKIDNNINTIQDLNLERGDDVNPEVNKIISQKVNDLMQENQNIIAQNEEIASKLSADQVKQIFDIDDNLEENYNSAKSIINDPSMDGPAKELLLDDLLKKQNELKQQKDAIQKQTTSEIPVQPEAGASVQMAQGEPQAEPQGVTEEVKAEEAVVPEEEFVYETLPEKKEEWIGDFEIIDNRGGKADLERQGSNGNWYVQNNVTGRTVMVSSKSQAQDIIDNAEDYDFGQGETFTRPAEEIISQTITPEETTKVGEVAKATGTQATNIQDLYNVNKNIFGLSTTQSLASSIVTDKIIGTMAKRAGTTKDNIYKTIEFKKGTKSELTGDALFQELDKALSKSSGTTQVATTTGSYVKAANILKQSNVKGRILDYGAGLGLGTDAMSNVLGDKVNSYEINDKRWKGKNKVDYTKAQDIDGKFDGIVSLNVINVVPKNVRDFIIKDIFNHLKENGTAIISSRKFKGDIDQAKNFELGPEDKNYIIKRREGGEIVDVYQKGFDGDELVKYIKDLLGDNVEVKKDNSFGAAGVIIKKLNNANLENKDILFQDAQGAMELANDGKFIVYALTDPNVSTPLHEMAHIYEHYLQNKEKQTVLKWTGQKDWDRSTSEKFARGFEKYLAEGKAPNPSLQKIFDQFKEWLLDIYNGIKDSAIDIELNKDMRKIYDTMLSEKGKQRKAPSVDKILGKPAPDKVTVKEISALKDQIKLEAKAAREGAKFADDVRKSVTAKVKSFITRGKLSVKQQKSLLNGLKSNLLNPIMRERFFARMEKMFERVDYKDRLDEANTFRRQIRKLSKSDTLQDSVRLMASDFAKIIPDFANIDEFLEKAREVYNAIKTPGVKKTELSLRQAAVIEDINAFTKSVLKSQDEKVKNTLLAEYDYLVDAGLIDTKMSLDEIQKYIMDIESGAQKSTPDKEAEIRERVGALFNSLAGITNSIIETGENPLTGEEVELDSYTKDLIKNFAKMDLSKLDVRDVYRATEALDNFLVNGIIDNMQAMYQKYDGALKIKELADEGIVAKNLKRFGLLGATNIWSRAWASNISPIKSVLDLMFRSREIGTKVFNASGLRDISNASSQAKNIVQKIDKAYQERFFKTKPNGEAFDSAENVYQRGIYAYLKRNLIGTEQEVEKEFKRRKDRVQDTIDALSKSQDKKLIKKAEIYKKIFEPIKESENIKEVEEKIDDINKDAVKWRIAIFEKYYPEVKQVAASVYNTILEDDINYSPDIYEKIIEDGEPDVDAKSSFKMAFDYLNSEKSGTLMKNERLKSLPENRVLNFDFDYNNSSALGKMLTDIKTAPYVQKYKGFSNSKDFDKVFPDPKDRAIIKKRMNWYVNQVRNKNVSPSSEYTRSAAKLIRALSRFGTSRALGSISSVVKQAVPALFNTAINLSNNPQALVKGLALMRDKDAQKFISNSGYGIANRALESQTAIESADEMLEKVDVNSIDKISKAIGDTGKVYLDTFLKTGDVAAARASWMAYYINKLDQMGENTSNIDWATHTLNKEAADYAEDQVNLQQNVSDTDMLGKLLNTKNPGATIIRSMIIPFSSFIFNAKDKISTDLTILTSNANKEEKINAIKSLASTSTEMLIFESLSAGISSLIMSAAYAMLGYEEDEEEKEQRKDRYINMAITRMITDGISPFPNIGDKLSVGAINNILNYAQEDLDEEDRKLLYEYKPNNQTEMILGLIGGIPEIGAKAGLDIYDTGEMILSDVYYDKYGNEIVFSPEDKDKLKFVLASEILTLNKKYPLPSEVIRLNERLKSTIVKQNR